MFLPNNVDLSASGTFLTYLPGTGPGSVGREIRSVAHLNSLITSYNNNLSGLRNTAPCSFDAGLLCDLYDQEIFRVGLLPEGTQIGGDSLISQDVRVTKTINFSEKYRLQLIGEVFNLFNIANLVNVNDLVLPIEGTPANEITTLRPTQRSTSVFGTGGPRAFQFGAKFVF